VNGKKEFHLLNNFNILKTFLITPGFIDIHTHGIGGNKDLTEYWLNSQYTCERVVKTGTTSLLATITFPKDNDILTEKIINTIITNIGKVNNKCAIIEGIHAEGPIVSDLGGLAEVENHMSLCVRS
jgi:N-acetylglucosamine-6-phosphate deacetylase